MGLIVLDGSTNQRWQQHWDRILNEMDANTHHKLVADTKYTLDLKTWMQAINDVVCTELEGKPEKPFTGQREEDWVFGV